MKTRQGFVSNSSTTSFCIYGVCIEEDEIKKILKKEEDDLSAGELLEEEMENKKVSLFIQSDYDGNQVYIGHSFTSIGDDETGKQFKDRVKKEVNIVFNNQIPEKDFGTCEEAWRDS